MNKVMDIFRCVLLTIATLVSLSNSCYGKTNNRKDHELRGPVSAVVVKNIEFSIKFGEVVPTGKSNDTLKMGMCMQKYIHQINIKDLNTMDTIT